MGHAGMRWGGSYRGRVECVMLGGVGHVGVGGSCRGWVGHVGIGWGGVGHAGVGWVMQEWGGVGHAGVGYVM